MISEIVSKKVLTAVETFNYRSYSLNLHDFFTEIIVTKV
ncbi:MAG: hypothetical protein JWR05_2192 [Mucilaginibacter sp.]|nr:hypothetical protein [Mucilaginibacter sp.]